LGIFFNPKGLNHNRRTYAVPSDTPTILVRPVRPADATQLREHCFSANTLAEVEARIADAIEESATGTQVLFVAEVDGTVVATGTLIRNAHPLYAHRGELASLVVHPHYQRRGIARRIVETIREHAASLGLEILEVSCRGGTPAEQVYRRLGFVEYGRLPHGIKEPYGEGHAYDEVSFYMPLSFTYLPESSDPHPV
jgi:GNAT superfamily N-acetyltransferase